jgi:hypothetical protein
MREPDEPLPAASAEVSIEQPSSADARWCLGRYFAELAERFESGFDPGLGSVPIKGFL